jgi:hypothetical protein
MEDGKWKMEDGRWKMGTLEIEDVKWRAYSLWAN